MRRETLPKPQISLIFQIFHSRLLIHVRAHRLAAYHGSWNSHHKRISCCIILLLFPAPPHNVQEFPDQIERLSNTAIHSTRLAHPIPQDFSMYSPVLLFASHGRSCSQFLSRLNSITRELEVSHKGTPLCFRLSTRFHILVIPDNDWSNWSHLVRHHVYHICICSSQDQEEGLQVLLGHPFSIYCSLYFILDTRIGKIDRSSSLLDVLHWASNNLHIG